MVWCDCFDTHPWYFVLFLPSPPFVLLQQRVDRGRCIPQRGYYNCCWWKTETEPDSHLDTWWYHRSNTQISDNYNVDVGTHHSLDRNLPHDPPLSKALNHDDEHLDTTDGDKEEGGGAPVRHLQNGDINALYRTAESMSVLGNAMLQVKYFGDCNF